jgi:hypothetical protein
MPTYEEPRSSEATRYAALLSLPDELILNIINQLPPLPRPRQKTLIALTATCRQLRRSATEILLLHPVVDVRNVHLLVRTYLQYPDLARQATGLEFTTRENATVSEPSFLLSLSVPGKPCAKACYGIINKTSMSARGKKEWRRQISWGYQDAYICVLLVMLPKLEELRCGTGVMSNLDILTHIFHMDDKHDSEYVRDAFATVSSRLQCLEIPLAWYEEPYSFPCSLQNLRGCSSLKHLTMPSEALVSSLWDDMIEAAYKFFHLGVMPPAHLNWESPEMLPKNLETLTLSIRHKYQATALSVALCHLLCTMLVFKSCPKMRRITLYFHHRSTANIFQKESMPILNGPATGLGVEIVVQVRDTVTLAALSKIIPWPPISSNFAASETELMLYDIRGLLREMSRDMYRRSAIDGLRLRFVHGSERGRIKNGKNGICS